MGVLIINGYRIEHPDAGRPCIIRNPESGETLKAIYGHPLKDGRHLVEMLDVDQDWLDEFEERGQPNVTHVIAHVNADCLEFVGLPPAGVVLTLPE